jgi:hypothetical protein
MIFCTPHQLFQLKRKALSEVKSKQEDITRNNKIIKEV